MITFISMPGFMVIKSGMFSSHRDTGWTPDEENITRNQRNLGRFKDIGAGQ